MYVMILIKFKQAINKTSNQQIFFNKLGNMFRNNKKEKP